MGNLVYGIGYDAGHDGTYEPYSHNDDNLPPLPPLLLGDRFKPLVFGLVIGVRGQWKAFSVGADGNKVVAIDLEFTSVAASMEAIAFSYDGDIVVLNSGTSLINPLPFTQAFCHCAQHHDKSLKTQRGRAR